MEPDNNSTPVMLLALKVIAQMGALIVGVVGGALVLGLLLDQALGTKPLFIALLILGSVPVTLWVIYRYARHQSANIQAAHAKTQKEDNIQ